MRARASSVSSVDDERRSEIHHAFAEALEDSDEPDPFAASRVRKGEPAADKPTGSGNETEGEGMDEPDPFAAPPKKDRGTGGKKPETEGGDDEPDPFGAMPKTAPEAKAKPLPAGAEPDPFGE